MIITLQDYNNLGLYITTISTTPNIQFTQTTTNDKLENNGN